MELHRPRCDRPQAAGAWFCQEALPLQRGVESVAQQGGPLEAVPWSCMVGLAFFSWELRGSGRLTPGWGTCEEASCCCCCCFRLSAFRVCKSRPSPRPRPITPPPHPAQWTWPPPTQHAPRLAFLGRHPVPPPQQHPADRSNPVPFQIDIQGRPLPLRSLGRERVSSSGPAITTTTTRENTKEECAQGGLRAEREEREASGQLSCHPSCFEGGQGEGTHQLIGT